MRFGIVGLHVYTFVTILISFLLSLGSIRADRRLPGKGRGGNKLRYPRCLSFNSF